MIKLKTQETSKLLVLGEKLRENPHTILLSIPVFLFGAFWFSITKNSEKLAGSFGHMGISFKNYYKHHWQKKFLLKIAVRCFSISAKHAPLKGKPAVLLKLGQTWVELEKTDLGEKIFNEAMEIARKMKDFPMVGYLLSHRARLYVAGKRMEEAGKDLEKSAKLIEEGIKKRKDSLYYQIWLSGVELENADYFLALGEKDNALIWTQKAEKRAQRFNLETRKLDAKNMFEKIKKLSSPVELPL